jgi:hypothetical protein
MVISIACIRLVCREFVMLCRKLELFAYAFVAIDGSKFKAVNNRDKNFTKSKLKRRLEESEPPPAGNQCGACIRGGH